MVKLGLSSGEHPPPHAVVQLSSLSAGSCIGGGNSADRQVPSLPSSRLTTVLGRAGYYYPQETSIIQTTANSVLDLNWAGGFHSFLVALSGPVLTQFIGQANITQNDVYEPVLGRIIPYQVGLAMLLELSAYMHTARSTKYG